MFLKKLLPRLWVLGKICYELDRIELDELVVDWEKIDHLVKILILNHLESWWIQIFDKAYLLFCEFELGERTECECDRVENWELGVGQELTYGQGAALIDSSPLALLWETDGA